LSRAAAKARSSSGWLGNLCVLCCTGAQKSTRQIGYGVVLGSHRAWSGFPYLDATVGDGDLEAGMIWSPLSVSSTTAARRSVPEGGGDWAEVTARVDAEGQDEVMVINMGAVPRSGWPRRIRPWSGDG
jgi:hypothetical protein